MTIREARVRNVKSSVTVEPLDCPIGKHQCLLGAFVRGLTFNSLVTTKEHTCPFYEKGATLKDVICNHEDNIQSELAEVRSNIPREEGKGIGEDTEALPPGAGEDCQIVHQELQTS